MGAIMGWLIAWRSPESKRHRITKCFLLPDTYQIETPDSWSVLFRLPSRATTGISETFGEDLVQLTTKRRRGNFWLQSLLYH
ncbi:hypothetical protein CEXT_106371 [Caerostris extrusa]|uniref:Uncharacterized protein n=1 Tax=Caerostris extrusa TaxID=172846 RepID=A0AAV4VN34_CAEEX|nr:hypothetical protein CEXT_106371 [Caerostris extrusa]